MVSEGVRLRPLAVRDADVMAAWGDDPLFCDEAGWSPDLDPAERRVRWGELVRDPPADLIRLAGVLDGAVVGYVDLHGSEPGRRELGYLVGGRERWGRGLGTALARAGVAHGFGELGLDEIWAEAADANVASVRILQRIGMTETGRGDDTWYLGRRTFYRQFAMTRSEGEHRKETQRRWTDPDLPFGSSNQVGPAHPGDGECSPVDNSQSVPRTG